MKTSNPSPASAVSADALRDFSRSLPVALLRTREAVMARFRPMLRDHEITEQQWRVLRALDSASAPQRSGELSQLTLLSMPSLSRLLKSLEERELIRRTAHKEDQRAAQISISRSGRELVAKIAPLSEAQYGAIGEAIGEADIEQLYQLLKSAVARLGEPSPGDATD